jgi:hypothetical protein
MHWSRVIVRLFLIAVAVAPSAVCFPVSGMPYGKQDKAVTTGTWGGEHVFLEVSEKGADVEFDCARGQISQPIALEPTTLRLTAGFGNMEWLYFQ